VDKLINLLFNYLIYSYFLKNKEMMKDLFDSLFKSISNSSNQQKLTMDNVLELAKIYDVHID
jgi:hypothetical protein